MSKWTGRLRKLVDDHTKRLPADTPREQHVPVDSDTSGDNEGWQYLNRVRAKLDLLVEDFAKGRVNQAQFEELYAHYQTERRAVETLMTSSPASDAWRMAVTEGQSLHIRRRLGARVLGYAVYANHDEKSLRVYGEFATLGPKWVSPLLARVNRDPDQLFVVDSLATGGKEPTCLCAVPGRFATLLVLFTNEPARIQIQSLEDLHTHFEQANHRILSRLVKSDESTSDDLVYPYAAAFE